MVDLLCRKERILLAKGISFVWNGEESLNQLWAGLILLKIFD
jgi:hypothetical protein